MVARTISEGLAAGRRLAGPRPGYRILLYHAVGSRLAHDPYGLSISPARFEQHMALLTRHPGVRVVPFAARAAAEAPVSLAITFDDGYQDALSTAAPMLLTHRLPFTVFVTWSFVGRSRDYLTASELRELAALPGVTIGSHGLTHLPLARCEEAVLQRELDGSRRALEDFLGKPVTAIAYPHGSVDLRVREAASRAGYTAGACSRFDINGPDSDPLLLCRTEIVARDSGRVFLQKLNGAWDWLRWRGAPALALSRPLDRMV